MKKTFKTRKPKEIYNLYNGKVKLEFEPVRHKYTVNGEVKYGVTGIIGVMDKPALVYWAVNKAIEYIDDNWKINKEYDEVSKLKLLEKAKVAHRTFTKDAGDIGTLFHKWAEDYINSKINKSKAPELPKNKNLNYCAKNFLQWESENKIKWIASERKLYSVKYNYAGTIDAIAEVNGKLASIDLKTSSGIYNEHYLQAAAYAKAIEEELGKDFKELWIIRVSKTGQEFEAGRTDKIKEHFNAFLCCLGIYRWINNRKKEYYENKDNTSNKGRKKAIKKTTNKKNEK